MNKQTLETVCKNYNPDIELIGSGNVDFGHNLADIFLKQKENEELEKRADLENYFAFIDAVKKSRVDVDNKFRDRYEKEKLMKKYFKYTKLNGFKSLASCPDYAIGDAFKNKYDSALKKIKNYFGEKNEK